MGKEKPNFNKSQPQNTSSDVGEIIPSFVRGDDVSQESKNKKSKGESVLQESEDKKPEYKFQRLSDIVDESMPIRLKPGEEGYEEAEKIQFKRDEYSLVSPQDKFGISEHEEREAFRIKMDKTMEVGTRYWWLTEEYQNLLEKGELAEQIAVTVESGDTKNIVNIYVFGKPLSMEFRYEIGGALFFLAQIDGGDVFNLVDDIIIHNDSKKKERKVYNEKSGKYKKLNIAAQATLDTTQVIKIFHGGLRLKPGKGMEQFSSFMKSFIHEFGHFIHKKRLEKNWEERLGWKSKSVLKRGKNSKKLDVTPKFRTKWTLPEDSLPPTNYARSNPQEDFAESFAYLMLEPEKLDPNRRDFMIDEVLKQKSVVIKDKPKIDSTVLRGKDMVLPYLNIEQSKYKVTRGRTGIAEFFSHISKKSEAKDIEKELLEGFNAESVKDIKTNAKKSFRYEWWTRNPQYKEIMDVIKNNPWTSSYRNQIEGVIRYFGPRFIGKELSKLSTELSKLPSEREGMLYLKNMYLTDKIIAEKMLELTTIVASRVDLQEDLYLVSIIKFYQHILKRSEEGLRKEKL